MCRIKPLVGRVDCMLGGAMQPKIVFLDSDTIGPSVRLRLARGSA